MNKVFKLSILFLSLFILLSCGSKRPPTGGPVDSEKPIVIASSPEAYGNISNRRIEISFSKALDKSTLTSAIYIYPPIANKKINYESNTIIIQINETLQKDTNYFVTLTTRLKDTRGNALEKNQTLIFRSGILSDKRISGNILYEDARDSALPILLNILSADSLIVMSRELKGNSYLIEALNPVPYILKAYIDKNQNGRYDFAQEPYFEGKSAATMIENMDLNLAYKDSTLAQIRGVRSISQREIEISFTEEISSYGELAIFTVAENTPLPIQIRQLRKDKLHLITAEQDTSRYQLIIEKLRDLKQNETKRAGLQFGGSTTKSETAPAVISSNPRNGTSVNALNPILELTFTKIIPKDRIRFKLLSADKKEEIPLKVLSSDSNIYRFQAAKSLQNYRSYLLIIEKETSDVFGNEMEKDYELSFLPLFRN